MKTKMDLSTSPKGEKWFFASGIILGAIGSWLYLNKNNDRQFRKNRRYKSEELREQIVVNGESSEDEYAVTPIIWGKGTEFVDFVKRSKFIDPTPYTRGEVINFVSRYIKRVINVKDKKHQGNKDEGRTKVDKTKEALVIYMPYEVIEVLLRVIPEEQRNQKQGGLMALFAIDTVAKINKNQTFVLMPYDSNERAIIESNAAYGMERWKSGSQKISSIIREDYNGDIDLDLVTSKIDQYLKSDIE